MLRALREQRSRRWISLAIGLVILVALWYLAPAVLSVNGFPVDDFVEYWAAGRLNLTGDTLSTSIPSMTLTVTGIRHATSDCDSSTNDDPDGESDGAIITVNGP